MFVFDAGDRVNQIRFLPDGRFVVGLMMTRAGIEVWELPAGLRARVPLPDPPTWYAGWQLVVHPGGDRFSFAHGQLDTFTTAACSPVAWPPIADPATSDDGLAADRVIASDAGELLVVADGNPTDPWRLTTVAADGRLRCHVVQDPPSPYPAGFLPGGEYYVEVCGGRVVVRRFSDSQEVAASIYPSRHLHGPSVSPDGRYLGVIGYSSLYLYDLPTPGEPRRITGSGNFGNFVGFAFHPAGRTLAVIHGGPTLVKLYDLDTLKLRAKLNWKVGPLTCVAYSPDGQLAAVGSADGRVVVWDADE